MENYFAKWPYKVLSHNSLWLIWDRRGTAGMPDSYNGPTNCGTFKNELQANLHAKFLYSERAKGNDIRPWTSAPPALP